MLFGHRIGKQSVKRVYPYPEEQFEPVLRCSICTGEQTACVRNRETGKITELMLIRDEQDTKLFHRQYGFEGTDFEKIY